MSSSVTETSNSLPPRARGVAEVINEHAAEDLARHPSDIETTDLETGSCVSSVTNMLPLENPMYPSTKDEEAMNSSGSETSSNLPASAPDAPAEVLDAPATVDLSVQPSDVDTTDREKGLSTTDPEKGLSTSSASNTLPIEDSLSKTSSTSRQVSTGDQALVPARRLKTKTKKPRSAPRGKPATKSTKSSTIEDSKGANNAEIAFFAKKEKERSDKGEEELESLRVSQREGVHMLTVTGVLDGIGNQGPQDSDAAIKQQNQQLAESQLEHLEAASLNRRPPQSRENSPRRARAPASASPPRRRRPRIPSDLRTSSNSPVRNSANNSQRRGKRSTPNERESTRKGNLDEQDLSSGLIADVEQQLNQINAASLPSEDEEERNSRPMKNDASSSSEVVGVGIRVNPEDTQAEREDEEPISLPADTSSTSQRPPPQPGAVRVRGMNASYDEDEDLDTSSVHRRASRDSILTPPIPISDHREPPSDILVEATLVEETEHEEQQQADNSEVDRFVDEEQQSAARSRSTGLHDPLLSDPQTDTPMPVQAQQASLSDFLQNKRLQCLIIGLVLFVVVAFVVTLVVLVLFLRGGEGGERLATSSLTPSPSTAVPVPVIIPTSPPTKEPNIFSHTTTGTNSSDSSPANNTIEAEPTAEALTEPTPSGQWLPDNETQLYTLPLVDDIVMTVPEFSLAPLKNVSSPQSIAIEWLRNHPDLPSMEDWRKHQLYALATFYYSFEGPINGDYLDYKKHECEWNEKLDKSHVCKNGQVQLLKLENDEPSLPGPGIPMISLVEQMAPENLFLRGKTPPEISLLLNLVKITFTGYHGLISDLLPPITAMKNLQKLDIIKAERSPHLRGSVPIEQLLPVADQLSHLDFEENKLRGSVPTEMGLLSNLDTLRLHKNKMQGTLPSELGLLGKNSFLSVDGNELSGTLPKELGWMTSLTRLRLDTNHFTGPVPSELGLLTNLSILQIQGNKLDMSIPNEICKLPKLNSLMIDCNTKYCPCETIRNCQCHSRTQNEPDLMTFSDFILTGDTLPDGETQWMEGSLGNNITVLVPEFSNTTLNLTSSPQSRAIQWLLGHPELGSMPEWRKQQLFAIVTIHYSFSGLELLRTDDGDYLNHKIHECNWGAANICLNEKLQVLVLATVGSKKGELLQGTMPPEVALLSDMRMLAVADSSYEGNISDLMPPVVALKNMKQLSHLGFSDNPKLQGTLPMSQLLALSDRLTQLDTSQSKVGGALPTELGLLSNLTSIKFSGNRFTGSLPSELGLLPLELLELNKNEFVGSLPTELCLPSSLYSMLLRGTKLTGTLPTELGHLTNLRDLVMNNNRFAGPLPSEIGKMLSLRRLKANTMYLAGSLPSELGLLWALEDLELFKNKFTGLIPSELGSMFSLRELALWENKLTGAVPSQIGRLENVTRISLYNNSLAGGIPEEVCSIGKLRAVMVDCLDAQCPCSNIPESCQCGGME